MLMRPGATGEDTDPHVPCAFSSPTVMVKRVVRRGLGCCRRVEDAQTEVTSGDAPLRIEVPDQPAAKSLRVPGNKSKILYNELATFSFITRTCHNHIAKCDCGFLGSLVPTLPRVPSADPDSRVTEFAVGAALPISGRDFLPWTGARLGGWGCRPRLCQRQAPLRCSLPRSRSTARRVPLRAWAWPYLYRRALSTTMRPCSESAC